MVFRVAKARILRATSMRYCAAQAEPGHSPDPEDEPGRIKTLIMPNKMAVVALENLSPVSRISVLFRAGSRNEGECELGATHILRNAAGLGTKSSSAFGIMRNIQKIGGNLTASSDREAMVYTLTATRNNLPKCLKFLAELATMQVFKPWELSDSLPRLQYQLATVPVWARVLDLLHKAAFRTALGNSIFCPGHMVGKHSSHMMQDYVQRLFVSNLAAVAGVGVCHDDLLVFAQNLCLVCEPQPNEPAKYHGGEIRVDTGSELIHVAIGGNGASLASESEALAFAVLRYVMGTGPRTKYGWGSGSLLPTAVAQVAGEHHYAVSAFNVSYTDAGLFGLILSCPWEAASKIVRSAAKELKCGSVSATCVDRAKAQLMADLLMSTESDERHLQEIGSQALLLRGVQNAECTASKIGSVTCSDVNNAAKKLQNGKLSMVAMGKLSCVPYLDQL